MVKYNRAHRDGVVPLHVVLEILGRATTIEEARENMAIASEPQPVTLEEAAVLTEKSYRTMRRWVKTGDLKEIGRQPFACRGGGKLLVDLHEVRYLIVSPPRPGPKNGREAVA